MGWHHTIWQTVNRCCAIKSQTSLRTQISSLDLLFIWTDTYATRKPPPQHVTSCHNIYMPPHCLSAHDDLLTHYTNRHSVTYCLQMYFNARFFLLQKSDTHFTSAVQYLHCYNFLYKWLCTANTNLNKQVISSCQNNMRLATSKNRLKQIKIPHYHTVALMP